MPTARKERKGLEIEKGAFRLREMESVWGLKSRKGAKFLKLKCRAEVFIYEKVVVV